MALSNLVRIGGAEFTDQGRTFSETREERAVEVELASGKLVRYIKGEKRNFTISWQWLPSNGSFTYDGKAARNELRLICYNGATTSVLVRNGIGSTETYTVFVDSYSEEVVRRDPISGCLFYNVELTLREQ